MPGEIDLPLPDPGSLKRGRFTYFPVVPGRLEFAIEVRQAILRERPQVIALELPATLQAAWMRAVARLPEMSLIFYPDETVGLDQAIYVPIEPADPFTEAIRTGLEIGAEIVFADPDAGQRPHLKDAYPDPYAIRHIGLARYIEAYRVYPQPRSQEICAARRRHRLETAGRRSPGERPGGGVAQPARPACWTPWRSRRRSPWRARAARASSCSTRTPNRWPKSPSNIRSFSGATRVSAACRADWQPHRPAPRATGRLPRGRKGVRSLHRRAHRPLAAAPAGPLYAQPGAGRRTNSRPACSTWPWRRAAWPTTTTPGRCGRRPAAIRRRTTASRPGHRAHLGRRDVDGHAPHPPPPPLAQPQAAPAPLRIEAAQEGEDSRANGPAS